MPMLVIHYDRKTGRIGAWGDGDSEASHLPDHDIVRIETDAVIDPQRHKIVGGQIVEMADGDAIMQPDAQELAARVAMELAATDQFMMPDRHVPLRMEWMRYRQALRDLSKIDGIAAQLAAWPTRPEGFKS